MRPIRYTVRTVFLLLFLQLSGQLFGQMGFAFNIKKPEEYDERTLRSEKSDQGKFSLPTRFIQNTVTHFNYYFNANVKLNEVLERAKGTYKDDYSQLISFYNYTLDATRKDSVQLDSITYKSSSGIALHDLRGDWMDNLYLLWGASYYLQKKFDSAYLMFQFINYAFAPKEKDGYYLTIGSGKDGNSALSISTKEKKSLPKKIFSEPPSRNDAFIWQIRNFLAQDQFAEASSLIVTLRNDPNFPKRLYNDLHEVQAYYYYKQGIWDSAAKHLVLALSNATNKQEQARWEYLAGQLYELGKDYKNAEKYYSKVISHTTDPILDIYARLASIRTDRSGGERTIQKNVAELERMAKRDRYQDYRDIIYYMAAQMELEGKDVDAAMALLLKSTQASSRVDQKNKAFLQLAELSFSKRLYRKAYNYYDSIQLSDPSLEHPEQIVARKTALEVIAVNSEIIYRQDSLQRIAAMPEEERKDFVKKLVKQIRREQGLKDEVPRPLGSPFVDQVPTTGIFNGNDTKGEWYFYNTVSKQRGAQEFKAKWGNRGNVDNWRRSAAILGSIGNQNNNNQPGNGTGKQPGQTGGAGTGGATEISYDVLYGNLPLSKEQLQVSDDSLQGALFNLGLAYIQQIEDCEAGTSQLERLRQKYPGFQKMDEVLFNLYYCYQKNNDPRAAEIRKLIADKYPTSHFTTIATTGKDPVLTKKDQATKAYEAVYDLFIEGKFDEARAQKKSADSLYGNTYWTPQLLYIEAVYYVRQREDSVAIVTLQNILNQFPASPLVGKATTLIEVIKRRSSIEEELRNMIVTRATDSTIGRVVTPVVVKPKPVVDTSNKSKPVTVVTNPTKPVVKDSTVAKPPPPPSTTAFSYQPNAAHYVVMVLNKIDPIFANETKNAFARYNRDTYGSKNYSTDLVELDPDNRLMLIAPFANVADAMAYIDATKPRTATEIVPWLKGGKYSFIILSDNNFNILKVNKDIEGYRRFLEQYLPGKF